jgi:hypothetical protein
MLLMTSNSKHSIVAGGSVSSPSSWPSWRAPAPCSSAAL